MKRFVVVAALLLWSSVFVDAQVELNGDVFSVLEQRQNWTYKFGELVETDIDNVSYTLYDSKGRPLIECKYESFYKIIVCASMEPRIFFNLYDDKNGLIILRKKYNLPRTEITNEESLESFLLGERNEKSCIDYKYEYEKNGLLKSISAFSGENLIEKYIFKEEYGYRKCIKYDGNGDRINAITIYENPTLENFYNYNTYYTYESFGDALFDYFDLIISKVDISDVKYDKYGNFCSFKKRCINKWDAYNKGNEWIKRVIEYESGIGLTGEDFLLRIEKKKVEQAEKKKREEEENNREEVENNREELERAWRATHRVPSYAGPGVITEEVSSQWKCVTWSDPRIQKLCKKADFILYVGIPFTVTRDGQVLRYKTYDQKQKRFPTVLGWHCGPSSLVKTLDAELSETLYNALWGIVRKTKWNCGDLAGRFFIQVCWKSPEFKMKINDKNEWTYQSSSVFRERPNEVFLIRDSIITEYAEVQKALADNNGAIAKSIFIRLQNEDYNVKATTSSIDPHVQYFSESVADEIDEEKIREEMEFWIVNQSVVYDNSAIENSIESRVEDETIPFNLVEIKPSFMGGDANDFSRWVGQHLVYPEIAKMNGVQGRVTLQFTIQADGRLTNVKVLRGIDPSLDKEAVRCVSSSPRWKPAMYQGKPVSVFYTFPVIFQLR
ncbi:MAG: energy transducer TonB [Bacteroidales bacterium]|nr:energy transducer TonB [Bacteroidales bacterium]